MPKRTFKFDKQLGRVVEVTPEAIRPFCEEISASVFRTDGNVKPHRRSIARWPIHSEAMAVNPEDVAEQQAELARHCVRTDYDGLGRPILRDPAHRKAHAMALGFYDRNASYGDPTPQHYVESSHGSKAVLERRQTLRNDIRDQITAIERELGI